MNATATDSRFQGYLKPTESSATLAILEKKIQEFIAGCTDLPNCRVRMAFKKEMETPPAVGENWCSFYIAEVNERDWTCESFKDEAFKQSSTQSVSVLCSFFGVDALENASTLRDAVQIEQNRRELFRRSGLKFIVAGNLASVGDGYLSQWRDRVDLRLNFSRIKSRRYDIKAVADAQIVGHTEQRKTAFQVGYFSKEDN